MPPKRSSSGSSKAKKRRTSAPDWRVPIFYWRGKITNETTWSGTWVASETGLPSDAEFAESANTFALECSKKIGKLVRMSDGEALDVPTATFKGSYKLDNGDGLEDYSDNSHTICLQEGPPVGTPFGDSGWVSVAARGTTPFGQFVSLGKMVRTGFAGNGEHILTLARRYIADDDPRCDMSPNEALSRISAVDEGEEWWWACEEPWLALPWKTPEDWPEPLPIPEGLPVPEPGPDDY